MMLPLSGIGQTDIQKLLFESIEKNELNEVRRLVELHPQLMDSLFLDDQFLVTIKKYPVHQAFRYADKELVDYILANGADASRKQRATAIMHSKTKSCFELLVEYRDLEMLKYYHDKIPVEVVDFTDALQQAAESGEKDKVRFLLDKGERFLINE
jgi:hypothetical protein